ncbi:hypothetical protein GQ600_23423 [Phytophthora cactorum]|nr:hypothetical protein GQ600_23423 [Phytophthora cactorum]
MIKFMRQIHPEWMTTYINEKEAGEVELVRMVQRFANR